MKAVIFCGGAGKRMWPLSREKTPKQLNKSIFDGGSTFEMTVERARLVTTPENIFVSTNRNFVDEIQAQAQEIDPSHIIAEPAIRDVAPAVGLMAAICAQTDPNEPMLILWCDHVVRRPDAFQQMMQKGEQIILNGQAGIVFIGQKPRYPEENLGYIGFGDLVETQGEIRQYDFIDWYYRPSKERAEEFFASGRYAWNTGYFITTPAFLLDKYAEMAPEMYAQLLEIADSYGTDLWEETLNRIYPQIEKIAFDDKILTKIKPNEATVLDTDMGWFDPGSLYSLKSFLEEQPDDNVIRGHGLTMHAADSLIFNHSNEKPVVLLGLDSVVIVNMNDVTLVVHKDYIPHLKELVESLVETEYSELA